MNISHLYQQSENGQWTLQSNEAHTAGVARRAAEFASSFGMEEFGRVLGELHDKGKETAAFQQYIRRNSGYDPSARVVGDTHHAYVGAKIASQLYGPVFNDLLTNQIYSHHTGLHNYGDMPDLEKQMPIDVNTAVEKHKLQPPKVSFRKSDVHHISRMLFSCLVDADFLDTEAFMDNTSATLRQNKKTLSELAPLLDDFLAQLKKGAKDTPVNRIRTEVQTKCLEMSQGTCGFYSLTVPTGGGKTLSSLLWAMKHALHNGQRRIIIVIPYTSIIVQTAAVLKAIFGEENVLEHHSNVDSEQIKDEQLRRQMAMAMENWDYPIIVTTNVQLFESMFGNRPSVCRKLHNVADSVIILDEVQTLPVDYLQPIVDSLKTYNRLFHVSVLFTTASQPVLSGLIRGCNLKASFEAIDNITEIIPKEMILHERLRRVSLDVDNTGKTYDDVATALARHRRVLCIVNTKADAQEIYKRLPHEGITLHLSRMMCPLHIRETISCIKEALTKDADTVVRVVATQLVEAGVDIDFPVVYRQEAGLDSILQAAGRCNREGRLTMGFTHVFSLSAEHALPRGPISTANNARQNLGNMFDWFAPETMTHYFEYFYKGVKTFDEKEMARYLYDPCVMYFETAAKKFRLIEDDGYPIVVCWRDSLTLTARLKEAGPSYALMKKLEQYIVSVNKTNFNKLKAMGVLTIINEGLYALVYQQQYDDHMGLITENNLINNLLIE